MRDLLTARLGLGGALIWSNPGRYLVIVWSYSSRTYRGGGRVFRWSGHDDRRHEWHGCAVKDCHPAGSATEQARDTGRPPMGSLLAVSRGDRGPGPGGHPPSHRWKWAGLAPDDGERAGEGLPQTSRPLKAASGATASEQSRRRPPATPLPSALGWRSVPVAIPPREERTWTTDREATPARLRSARSGRQANDQLNRHTAGGHIRTGLE